MRVSLVSARPRRRVAVFNIASLFLAMWAGWALATQKLAVDGLVLIACSVAMFAWGALDPEKLVATPRSVAPVRPLTGFPYQSLAVCLAFSALAFLLATGNRFRPEMVVAWGLAIVFYVRTFWLPGEKGWMSRLEGRLRSSSPFEVRWSLLGLAGVMLVAAFFRYYQIGTTPAEPTSDIAEKLLDVRDVLNGRYSIFFERNTGREAFQFYVAVPFVQLFGLTHLALKVEQATVSLMTIPIVYLIGREVGGAKYGLLAAFFLAISKWDVAIARVGLRFPLYPFFVALAFYFLLRALRRGTRNDFLLCGLATGVGMYGYSPFRAMALVIPALVAVKLLSDRLAGGGNARRLLEDALVCAGAALVVFLPLARYMLERPDTFWFRALTRMANAEAPLPDSPARVFLSNVVNALLMFNWRGDVVWVNTIPYDPALDFISGGLFLLGLAWCLVSLIRDREPVAAYLLVALPLLLLPSILSLSFPAENPSVVRAGGAGPIVALLVAAPVLLAWKRAARVWETAWGKGVVAVAIAGLVAATAWQNYDRYFVVYPVQYRQSAVNSTEMAAVINGFAASTGSLQAAFIKSYPYWVDTRNVAFEIGKPDWNNVLLTTEDITTHTPPRGNKLYIIHKDDREGIAALQQRFPTGQLRVQPSATPDKEFLVFFVAGEK